MQTNPAAAGVAPASLHTSRHHAKLYRKFWGTWEGIFFTINEKNLIAPFGARPGHNPR
jgi:hypothetical protein